MNLPLDHAVRLERARRSLEGLSVGDAFGDQFFIPGETARIEHHQTLKPPWRYTDDTEMALSIVRVLQEISYIDQDLLAFNFGDRYHRDPNRGYGGTAHRILRAIGEGVNFRKIAPTVFEGQGSMGNGAAMRAGPLGAYFAGDLPSVIVEQARLSAEVTHANPDGIAGAVAVALAAAWAATHGPVLTRTWNTDLLDFVIAHVPDSYTLAGLQRARSFQPHCSVITAAAMLGNGSKVTAPDTVPFALWCASHVLHDYAESLWTTVSALGDRDTTCAIVGSITILTAPETTVPAAWLAPRNHWFDGDPPRTVQGGVMAVTLVEGDLLDQSVEVIVNAWNRNIIPWWLLLPQGVSGAIKRRGGTAPFRELARHGPIPLGGAVLTSAGRLPFKAIIHVAGISMLWRASERSIRDSVANAMAICRERGLTSIAFPLIGAGSGGFAAEKAQAIMREALSALPELPTVVIVRYRKK